jgi:hypothetical protein
MRQPKTCLIPLTASVVILSLILFTIILPATAQTNNNDYIFLLASGFLCDPRDSSTCPAMAKSAQGDSYEMSGAGTFDAQGKSVKATGTYTHKSSNGNVLETGVWIASELVSFDSYGVAPNELTRLGVAFGPAAMTPKRTLLSIGPMPTGGLAVFRILLVPISGRSTTAVLQVNSALGDVPRARSVEGIRLALERNNSEYSEEISGRVMFLSIRPEMSAPVKTPQEEKAPENSEQPHN